MSQIIEIKKNKTNYVQIELREYEGHPYVDVREFYDDEEGRRLPTEDVVVGNPMASPFAADSVKMPQDLQLGYVHMNRFGSPLPIHGLGTPGRTTMAQDVQDGNLVMQHRMRVANRNPVGMSRVPFLNMDPMDYAMVD